jgi:hypothetical protein
LGSFRRSGSGARIDLGQVAALLGLRQREELLSTEVRLFATEPSPSPSTLLSATSAAQGRPRRV